MVKRRSTQQARDLAGSNRAFARARTLVVERDCRQCVLCGAPGDQVHHRIPRGMGGSSANPDVHSLSRLILLCGLCHDSTEAHPKQAFELGTRVHRNDDPAAVRCWYRGRWVLLTDNGSVLEVSE